MQKKKFNLFTIGLVVFVALITVNCSNKNKNNKTRLTTGNGQVGGEVKTSSAPNVNGAGAGNTGVILPENKVVEAKCANPIELETQDLQLLKENEKMVGKFQLVALDFHMHSERDGSSYYIVSNADETFEPSVECNELTAAKDSSKKEDFGLFSIAEWIDSKAKLSGKMRAIKVVFENGKVASRSTGLIGEETSIKDNDGINLDRKETRPDNFVSTRRYLLSEDSFEVRIKIEFPKDVDGSRMIHHGRAVYQRVVESEKKSDKKSK